MDLLLIMKDGSAASVVSNCLLAMKAREAGTDARLFFSSEALVTLVSGAFLWPRELATTDWRWTVADAAKVQSLPIVLRGEARQIDVQGIFTMAQEAGVVMYADPIWTDLLGLRGKLPSGITELDAAAGLQLIGEAKQVIGSL
jgi:hypothetical protein